MRKGFLRSTALVTMAVMMAGCSALSNSDSPISRRVGSGAEIRPWERNLCGRYSSTQTQLSRMYPTQLCEAFAVAVLTWKHYSERADDIANDETLLNLGIAGLAAGAIWAAVKEESADTIALLGIGSAVLYSGSSVLVPEQKRKIYRAGAKAAACLMRRSNHLLNSPVFSLQVELNDLMVERDKLADRVRAFGETNLSGVEGYSKVFQPTTTDVGDWTDYLTKMALKPYLAPYQKLRKELVLMQDQMKEFKRSEGDLGGVAVEISQSLVELDNKVKELLDETLPNPASLFETVQSTTNTYLGMAMSVSKPQSDSLQDLAKDKGNVHSNVSTELSQASPTEKDLQSNPMGIEVLGVQNPVEKQQEALNQSKEIIRKAKNDTNKKIRDAHDSFDSFVNDALILQARLDALYPKFAEELKQTVSVELADCRDLGITSPFMVMPKNIEIAAGEVGEITISGGRRPIYASFNRQRAGVTIEDSVNKFGDTVISIRWDGRAGVAGDYPIEFVDYSGAKDVGLVTFLPGIALAEYQLLLSGRQVSIRPRGSASKFLLFYRGGGKEEPKLYQDANKESKYEYGAELSFTGAGPIQLFTEENKPEIGETWQFMLVEKGTGLSTNFTVSLAKK